METPTPTHFTTGVKLYTLDAHYLQPQFAAVYLLVTPNGDAHLIDCATGPSYKEIHRQIQSIGIALDQIKSLWVTHVHLDHAGGASRWSRELPWLKIYAHPKTAKHLHTPERLVSSAKSVYGESKFEELYGKIEPIALDRIHSLNHEEQIQYGKNPQLTFTALHTRGHANHHVCFYLPHERIIFSGDTFGLHYPKLTFSIPSTSPTDFNAELAIESIELIRILNVDTVYPTHFGAVTEIQKKADELISWLKQCKLWQTECNARLSSGNKNEELLSWLIANWKSEIEKRYGQQNLAGYLDLDIELNAQGIIYASTR